MGRPLRIAALTAAALGGAAAAYTLTPISDPDLDSRPDPARSYADALERIAAIEAAEDSLPLHAEGRSFAMLHSETAERAVVLLHGYTDMPGQFHPMAEGFFRAGYNVWVPRMPLHGELDRMTTTIGALTPQLLRAHTDTAFDVAAGLGHRVEAVGLSGGGALATWAAVTRPELSSVVAISPLFKPLIIPELLLEPTVRLYRLLPDRWEWWDEERREELAGPGYPRFTHRGIAAFLELVHWAKRHGSSPAHAFPAGGEMTLLANDGDEYIDAAYNRRLAEQIAAPRPVRVIQIPATDGLRHDLVRVDGANSSRIDLAYAWLGEAVRVDLGAT